MCFESAALNDKNALEIFNEAGYELSLLVKMIINELEFKNKILISYSVGVFNSEKLILDPLKRYLEDYKIKFIKPILGPGMGACLLAYKMINENLDEEIINNMVKNLEYKFA